MPTLEKIVSVWAAVCEFSEWGSIISHPALETQCAAFVGEVEKEGCLRDSEDGHYGAEI